MPVLNKVAQFAVTPLPHRINPTAHAIYDYVNTGIFLIGAAAFWRRNKRAAVGALVGASSSLILALITDHPGGVRKILRLPTHRDLEIGLATMVATMPEFLGFKDEPERKFFLAEGILITAVNQLTARPGRRKFLQRDTKAA
jgi:hypothetical protein